MSPSSGTRMRDILDMILPGRRLKSGLNKINSIHFLPMPMTRKIGEFQFSLLFSREDINFDGGLPYSDGIVC